MGGVRPVNKNYQLSYASSMPMRSIPIKIRQGQSRRVMPLHWQIVSIKTKLATRKLISWEDTLFLDTSGRSVTKLTFHTLTWAFRHACFHSFVKAGLKTGLSLVPRVAYAPAWERGYLQPCCFWTCPSHSPSYLQWVGIGNGWQPNTVSSAQYLQWVADNRSLQ